MAIRSSLELLASYRPEILGFSPGAGNWLKAELAWAGTQVAVLQARASHCTPMQSVPIPRQTHNAWLLPTIGTVLPGWLWGPWLLA